VVDGLVEALVVFVLLGLLVVLLLLALIPHHSLSSIPHLPMESSKIDSIPSEQQLYSGSDQHESFLSLSFSSFSSFLAIPHLFYLYYEIY